MSRFFTELYEAPEHLIASHCTPAQLTRVPIALATQLRFIGGSRKKGLAFRDEGILHPQTMREIRELALDSASRLDDLLGEFAAFFPR